MFRKMRGKQKLLSQEACIDILKTELRGVLSVSGDDGYPYGFPIDHWYCETNGKIYFHCGKTGHKLDAIRRNDKVSFCVYDQGYHKDGHWSVFIRSVIIFGRITVIDDPAKNAELCRRLSYKFTQDSDYIEEEIRKEAAAVLCLELTPEHMTGKLVHEA